MQTKRIIKEKATHVSKALDQFIICRWGDWLCLSVLLATQLLVMNAGVPAVLKFLELQSCPEIVLKSQSFSTNVLILTIVVRAYLLTSCVDPVLCFVSL